MVVQPLGGGDQWELRSGLLHRMRRSGPEARAEQKEGQSNTAVFTYSYGEQCSIIGALNLPLANFGISLGPFHDGLLTLFGDAGNSELADLSE